jgi:hypothetical protein
MIWWYWSILHPNLVCFTHSSDRFRGPQGQRQLLALQRTHSSGRSSVHEKSANRLSCLIKSEISLRIASVCAPGAAKSKISCRHRSSPFGPSPGIVLIVKALLPRGTRSRSARTHEVAPLRQTRASVSAIADFLFLFIF